VRTAISFLLFFHLFALFVAVAGNVPASNLLRRLRIIPRAYLQALDMDLSYRFNFTQGAAEDRGWIAEVELGHRGPDKQWITDEVVPVPVDDLPHGLRHQRYYNLVRSLRITEPQPPAQDPLRKEWQDVLAEAIGKRIMVERGVDEVKFRVRAQELLAFDEVAGDVNPDESRRFETIYQVLVKKNTNGVIPDNVAAFETAPTAGKK
jgi:hypothetical protein